MSARAMPPSVVLPATCSGMPFRFIVGCIILIYFPTVFNFRHMVSHTFLSSWTCYVPSLMVMLPVIRLLHVSSWRCSGCGNSLCPASLGCYVFFLYFFIMYFSKTFISCYLFHFKILMT